MSTSWANALPTIVVRTQHGGRLALMWLLLSLAGCSCNPPQAQQNQRLQQEVQALRIENQGLRQALLRERREELRMRLDERRAAPVSQ